MKKHCQTVAVEFKNGGGICLYNLESNAPVNLGRVVDFFENTQDFNCQRDSLYLVDPAVNYDLDEAENLV